MSENEWISNIEDNFLEEICNYSQIIVIHEIKNFYRQKYISKESEEKLLNNFPEYSDSIKKFIKNNNSSKIPKTTHKIRSKRKKRTIKNPVNQILENQSKSILYSSKYEVGQKIETCASNFTVEDGIIYYDNLHLKSKRISSFDFSILERVSEQFTIVVEYDTQFHFEPFNHLSKFLACCEAAKIKIEDSIQCDNETSLLSLLIYKAKEEIDKNIAISLY